MKKFIVFGVILLTVCAGMSASQFFRGKTLSSNEVLKKWGKSELDFEKFKKADYVLKAKMAFAVMTDKKLIGTDVSEIRKNFGDPDGFYFIDSYPAYIIQEGQNHSEETWQIVFLLNEKYKVRDIIVHRNCCDK